MPELIARDLYNQRLRECISLDSFANEMQTTYVRHLIQAFMCYAEDNHHKEMFRYAWLEVFCYWMNLNECELCSTKLPLDEWPKEVIRFCDYCSEAKEHE